MAGGLVLWVGVRIVAMAGTWRFGAESVKCSAFGDRLVLWEFGCRRYVGSTLFLVLRKVAINDCQRIGEGLVFNNQ